MAQETLPSRFLTGFIDSLGMIFPSEAYRSAPFCSEDIL